MVVGVLALQGDFEAHRRRLAALGVSVRLVRRPADWAEVDALVIPGGESTSLLRLLGDAGMAALRAHARAKPVFGTCAGAILLASEVDNPPQASLGIIDIGVERNAYGRQADSFIREGVVDGRPMEMVCIRAPRIVAVGRGVEVIGTLGDEPMAVRQGAAMAVTFHPELSEDTRLHQMFVELAATRHADAVGTAVRDTRGHADHDSTRPPSQRGGTRRARFLRCP